MLPSMPIISTLGKEGLNEEGCSRDQNEASVKALDLSLSAKKSSPLKHVTPILKKYNTQRKGKGGKKIGPQIDQVKIFFIDCYIIWIKSSQYFPKFFLSPISDYCACSDKKKSD